MAWALSREPTLGRVDQRKGPEVRIGGSPKFWPDLTCQGKPDPGIGATNACDSSRYREGSVRLTGWADWPDPPGTTTSDHRQHVAEFSPKRVRPNWLRPNAVDLGRRIHSDITCGSKSLLILEHFRSACQEVAGRKAIFEYVLAASDVLLRKRCRPTNRRRRGPAFRPHDHPTAAPFPLGHRAKGTPS